MRCILSIFICLISTASLAIADGIIPPQEVTYTCPKLPNSFKVGGYLLFDGKTSWFVPSIAGVARGSTINIGSKDQYQYVNNAVYASIFGKTLWCYAKLTIDGKEYAMDVNTQVLETTCNPSSDHLSFVCRP